jgi:hypothetical protein
MEKTRLRLYANGALAATLLLACGQTSGGSSNENSGGKGGHGATPSSTGGVASGGLKNSGGSPNTASGGLSPTGGVAGNTGGKSPGGAGGTSSGGFSSSGHSNGGEAAGAPGLAGAGGARECPVFKCTATCAENWLGLDGCPTCTCAPPATKLSVLETDCPSATVTLTAASSFFMGAAVDRWLLDFEWTCSDHSVLGEPLRAYLQVGIIQPLTPALDGGNRTFFYPRPAQSGLEYEVRTATVFVAGSGVPEIEGQLSPSTSFLSIRLENGVLVGGVSFTGANSAKTIAATMAGPFSVAVPSSH